MKKVTVCKEGSRLCLSVILLLCFIPVQSQNLVPNSSFEDFVDFAGKNTSGWHKIQLTDTPEYYRRINFICVSFRY